MARLLLGVTGSVAAIHTPLLYEDLRRAGHEVRIVATTASLYFFNAKAIGSANGVRDPSVVVLDQDEWPDSHYQRGDRVLHIELRRWAEVFLIAPLDANTLAKLAGGFADNCLTCVWRAWDRSRPAILAPAMNTVMWENPMTSRHLRQLAEDVGLTGHQSTADPQSYISWINSAQTGLKIVAPISKRLACDDVGLGAMADRPDIIAAVGEALSAHSG